MLRSTFIILTLPALFMVKTAFADAPYISNNVATGHERVQDGDKVCETSKPTTTVNAGVYSDNGTQYMYQQQDKGGYVGISIPLGGGSDIDCGALYDKMLKTKDMENEQKEAQIQILKQQLAAAQENLRLSGSRAMTAN